MNVFGTLSPEALAELRKLLVGQAGLEVQRHAPARSSVPHPQSTDLELALKPHLEAAGFQHQSGSSILEPARGSSTTSGVRLTGSPSR